MIKKGQRYIADEDLTITRLTAWRAPYTGGYSRTLPAGEEFVITNDPTNYDKLHKLVRALDRSHQVPALQRLRTRLDEAGDVVDWRD